MPTLDEVTLSIKQLTAGKAAGADGIPPDIFKCGGETVAQELHPNLGGGSSATRLQGYRYSTSL